MCGKTGGEPSCHSGVRDRGNDRFDARNFQFLAASPFPSAARGPAKLDDLIVSDDKSETAPSVSPPVLPMADRLPYPFLAKFCCRTSHCKYAGSSHPPRT